MSKKKVHRQKETDLGCAVERGQPLGQEVLLQRVLALSERDEGLLRARPPACH